MNPTAEAQVQETMPEVDDILPEIARRAWAEAVEDPTLNDLPFRIETNRHGQLVLSRRAVATGFLKTGAMLTLGLECGMEEEGPILSRCPVETPEGVKAPDLCWISASRWEKCPKGADALPLVPEICIELQTEWDPEEQLEEKRRLYFDDGLPGGGAEEVWIIDGFGQVRFYSAEGAMEASRLAPDFPTRVEPW